MKRFLCLSALVLGLAMSSHAFACNTLSDGYISKVDTDKKEVIVDQGGKSQSFTAADKTQVTINGKAATLAQIKSGDKVQIDYETNTDVVAIKVVRES